MPTTIVRPPRGGTPPRRRHVQGVGLTMVLVFSTIGFATARADTAGELDSAKQKLEHINDQVNAQLAELDDLRAESDQLATEVNAAETSLEEAQARLTETTSRIAGAEARYAKLSARLNDRAAQMFISGPASTLSFLLGASSMADMSDRIQFSSAVADADVELANEVENLRVQLEMDRADQARAVQDRTAAYNALHFQLAALEDRFTREKDLYASILHDRGEAETLVAGLRKRYQDELAALVPLVPTSSGGGGSSGSVGTNPFSTCPVGEPHALTDSFGAPRYGGGFHLHSGNDIMAPEGVPIYATFSGTAYDASNALGGISVRVVGATGWTYNAHMVRIGKLGSVQAGDVIGYVGATGDTSTPHNHFEWHPNTIPASWPNSAYGYSIIGDAVNPYPILAQVC
ncbi:MAG: peptidoglycan DD-metalloendopeptidase family protein [Actinomycetota bacterium]|nr:peptidoglycan DD-metalloendopeptidase family protein [Actinomycetota bacterium]